MAAGAKITTNYGDAVPPAPYHAVTVHMPGWELAKTFGQDPMAVLKTFKSGYPRMYPHRDIVKLSDKVLDHIGAEGKACFLFTSLQTARECVAYSTSPLRDDGLEKKPVTPESITIRTFKAKIVFFAVTFPVEKRGVVFGFFSAPGSALSSRCAEVNLQVIDTLHEIDSPVSEGERSAFNAPAHQIIRQRIANFTSSSEPQAGQPVDEQDVYLFSSGMASIYKPHTYFLTTAAGTTVLFGMAFMHSSQIFKEYGPGMKWFGLGTESDIDDLTIYLKEEYDQGREVQAIWTEYPANPLLVTPDIDRLRALADQYGITLAIDDTLGSFSNVTVLQVADLLVTSLTKTFSGYADVLAGSVVLNRLSKKYRELKTLIDASYVPELYEADAIALEQNSRDYIRRTAIHNRNAAGLARYLCDRAANPSSAVHQVHYPTINASGENFRKYQRPATAEFTPGFGCLLSVELEDMETAGEFYDSLEVHKGPHLGAPLTLAIPYCLCIYGKNLEWAAEYGLRPTQIRISTGLEDEEDLLATFRVAVEAADEVKRRRTAPG